MNSLENIIAKIINDAEDYRKISDEQSKSECGDIMDNYKSEGEFIVANIKAESEKKDNERILRAESGNALAMRNSVLEAKISLIGDAFSAAAEKICGLPKKEKLEFYTRLFNKDYDGLPYEVIFNEADRTNLGDEFIKIIGNENIKLSNTVRPILGGFILKREGIEINFSVEEIMKEMRPLLERDVCEILFN